MKPIFVLYCIVCLAGCRNTSVEKDDYFKSESTRAKSIKYASLAIDSLKLDSIPSSFQGEICLNDSSIYFVDQKFCYAFKFNKEGKFVNKYIGQGGGPNELPVKTICFFTPMPGGGFCFIGPSWDCFIFDRDFKRVNDYAINWHAGVTREEMLKNPDPSQTQLYSLLYGLGEIRATKEDIYLPILSQHPHFNPLYPSYYKDARILAKMDQANGYVDKIFGRFSNKYNSNPNEAAFPYFYFNLTAEDQMQIAFPPDSLIYRFTDNFDILGAYGFSGRDMDTNYHKAASLGLFSSNLRNEKRKKGYYSGMEYIKERNLTFRSYMKNEHEKSDGLQIYRADTLIADVDVPKGLKVKGYIAPWFISNAFIDEDNETIKVYKFQLKDGF